MTSPLLHVEGLKKYFPIKGGILNRTVAEVQAVDEVNFDVARGETLGIVGESGCGKSTTARLLMQLIAPDAGALVFDGMEVGRKDGISVHDMRKRMQMVFQDSYSSLNPRLPIEASIAFGPLSTALHRQMLVHGPGIYLRRLASIQTSLYGDIRTSCLAVSANG